MEQNLLTVKDLRASFRIQGMTVQAVRGVDFEIAPGEIVGLVGESGSGKSVTMKSIIRMLPDSATLTAGEIRFGGLDLMKLTEKQMQSVRGNSISMIFQDPMTSLNPLKRVGDHIVEVLRRHNPIGPAEAWRQAVDMLGLVGVPSPEERMKQYPHEFSGGMRQRVLIAMALACRPKLLIADEPTTALDVTIQAQILDLIRELQQKTGMAVVLITHDLGIVANLCKRLMVMYGGLILETGSVEDIFYRPMHPYTRALLRSVPSIDSEEDERLTPIDGQAPSLIDPPRGCPLRAPLPDAGGGMRGGHPGFHRIRRGPARALPGGREGGEGMSALLEAVDLKKYFTIRGAMGGSRVLKAVDGVSLAIEKGETFGLVGESGCGKTTLGRTMIRLYDVTGGTLKFGGNDITTLSGRALSPYRQRMQIIFQDPYSSLNPFMNVEELIAEPLDLREKLDRPERRERIVTMLQKVGMDETALEKYPHEFSGGQRQRVGIARALVVKPEFVLCDEPISALDVSIQAQVVNMLEDLQQEDGPHLPLRRPRSFDGPAHLKAHRRHVPGPHRGNLALEGAVQEPAAPLHPGAALRHPDSGPKARPGH